MKKTTTAAILALSAACVFSTGAKAQEAYFPIVAKGFSHQFWQAVKSGADKAAKANGVRRVVFASSIHAVSGYPADYQVHTEEPVNPGDLYGVSKCFGEALGRYMESLHRSGDMVGARQAAERYLGRYPTGPHSELGHRLLGN